LELARLGAVIGYGPDLPALFYRAGRLIGRILKGADPANLPVEQASEFLLLINGRAAKSIGFSIPATLLARADQVIE
jgi:putative ABC transport system substrate-binding protein